MPRSRLVVFIICLALFLSACTPGATALPPTPTAGLQALPQNLPTATALPTTTPLPTSKPFLTPTSLYLPTATVPVIYTALPGTKTVADNSARQILLYEDTGEIGAWIKEVLDKMKSPYTYASGSGSLLKQLQTDTRWDVIILAAEYEASIQGELWDLINQKIIDENTALIAELWFIDLISSGKIKPFLDNCGVELSTKYNLKRAVPVYVIDAMHPIFNMPNGGFTVIKPAPFFDDQAVDYLRLLPDSPAKVLASGVEGDNADHALIVSCYDGRVLLQTFLNHDFNEATIKALWENYITYMLQRPRQ